MYKNFCTGQFTATTMITVPPSIILYDDQSKDVDAMRWLDCSSEHPEAAKVMYTRQSWSTDMCLMKNDKQVGRKSVARSMGREGIHSLP